MESTNNGVPLEPQPKSSKTLLIIIIAVLASAIVVGLATYFVMAKVNSDKQTDLEKQIEYLQQKIDILENQLSASDGTNGEQDEFADWQIYQNDEYGYSFKYPKEWNAKTNRYNSFNVLFGPDATSRGGLGGIEIEKYEGTLESYLDYMTENVDVVFLLKQNININGLPGIQVKRTSSSVNGFSVLLKNRDEIVNIYINSWDDKDIEFFNQILSMFKFLD